MTRTKTGGEGGARRTAGDGVLRVGREGAPPHIDSVAFARAGTSLIGQVPLAALVRLGEADVAPSGSLDWRVQGDTASDPLGRRREFLQVALQFAPTMTCARCLEPVVLAPIVTQSRFRLAASERQAEIEDRDTSDVDVLAHAGDFDLAALVEDEAILALPMVPCHAACPPGAAAAAVQDDDGDV